MRILNKLLCFGLLLLCGSCNSWLDVDLKNQMEEHKLFSTEEGFREALVGVYGRLVDKEMYGQELTFGVMDILGQAYDYYHLDDKMRLYSTYAYTSESVQGKIDGFWERSFATISSINNILRFVESNEGGIRVEVLKQIKGEALALRAFLHFDLYRMFAPDVKLQPDVKCLPYVKNFGVEKTPFLMSKEFVDFVIADLKEAEELLINDPILSVIPYQLGKDVAPEEQTKNEADTYVARMNYWAVKAMLARVYLAIGNITDARLEALEVIGAQQFRLVDYASSLDIEKEAYWDILFSDEHIFSLKHKSIRSNAEASFQQSLLSTQLQVTPLFIEMLYPNIDDWRRLRWFNGSSGVIMKYTRENDTRFSPKVPLIRLAEMYFIVAETYLDEQNFGEAKKYIDLLRDSRIKNNVPLFSFSKEDLLLEMRRDFIAEGQYFFMYKRLNHSIPTLSVDVIEPSDRIFVFPLPEIEVVHGNR